MIDTLGSVVIELRDDVPFGTWCEERVRGVEPAPGDAQGAGNFRRFAVVSVLDRRRERRAPVQYVAYTVAVYGLTPQDADAGYGLASDAIHARGPRLRANGIGIYHSFDDPGGVPDIDPGTKQPLTRFTVRLIAPTQVVAA